MQYGLWLKRMSTLDFGHSFASHQSPVFWHMADKEGNVNKGMIQEALHYLTDQRLKFRLDYRNRLVAGCHISAHAK